MKPKEYKTEIRSYGIIYLAQIKTPKHIASVDPFTGMIGEWRPYSGEYLADHLAHSIPRCMDATKDGIEYRFNKDQNFVAVR